MILCTTTRETKDFDSQIDRIASQHGFRIFRSDVPISSRQNPSVWKLLRKTLVGEVNLQSLTDAARDEIIRDSVSVVRTRYTIFLDGDTVGESGLAGLVGLMKAKAFDLASVRVLASKADTLIERLQGIEYELSMDARRIYPWLTSGACLLGKTEVLGDIMRHHSLFFSGGDIEVGKLARMLKYRVGHIAFKFYTDVPDTFTGWFKQRMSWCGGGFRHTIVNFHKFTWRHPIFYLYTTVIVYGLTPWRWYEIIMHPWILPVVIVFYWGLIFLFRWNQRRWFYWLFPFYSLLQIMIILPLGVCTYLRMVWKSRNIGLSGYAQAPRGAATRPRGIMGLNRNRHDCLSTNNLGFDDAWLAVGSTQDMKTLRRFKLPIVLFTGAASLLLIRSLIKNLTLGTDFPKQYTLAAWEWRSPVKADKFATKARLALLQSKGVDTVFLTINDYLDFYELPDPKERETRLREFDEAVSTYNALASEQKMEVYALAGNITWGKSSHHYLSELALSYVRSYNQAHPDHPFVGVQFDIEPQSMREFSKAPDPLLRDYFDLLATLVEKTNGDPELKLLKFGVTMPFWFDGENPIIHPVSWHGQQILPYQHVIDVLGQLANAHIVVMAYRVNTTGRNGSIVHSKTEIKYANQTDVRVLIGQEISNVQPESITFWSKDEPVFRRAIVQLARSFGSDDSFAGVAINDVASYEYLLRSKWHDKAS